MLQIKHTTTFVPNGCNESINYNAITIGVSNFVHRVLIPSHNEDRLAHISNKYMILQIHTT